LSLIIGIGHRQLQGKDTLARFITSEIRENSRGISIETRKFANKLKEITFSLYAWAGLERPEYYELHPEKKNEILPKIGKSARTLWIEYGQKMREIDPFVWINPVLLNFSPNILLISDLRFPNEVNKIKELNGFLIKCVYPERELSNDEADIALADFNGWDYIAESNNLSEIHKHASKIVERFCATHIKRVGR